MIKRALVLSGGGSRGIYQVGALKALIETGRRWTSVHGISVGSLNGSWLASYSDKEDYNISGLCDIWKSIEKTEDMVDPWSNIRIFNYLMSIWKGSLHSRKNLQTIINKHILAENIVTSDIKLTVGCVSLNTGEYRCITGADHHVKDFVLASSLLPVVYEPILINGEKWVDGGIRHQIPIVEALMEHPDVIDVILTRNPVADYDIKHVNDMTKLRSAPRIALRASEIMNDQIYQTDFNAVLRAIGALGNVQINLYLPLGKPAIKDSLTFKRCSLNKTFQQGYEETQDALNYYSGKTIR